MSKYVKCDEYLGTCDVCRQPVRLTNILVYPYKLVEDVVTCYLHPDDHYKCKKCGGLVNRINVVRMHHHRSIYSKEKEICQN